jgi:hypothetical protein
LFLPDKALIEAIPEGATLLGDKGYDSNAIAREAAAARNVWANIPNRSNRKQHFTSDSSIASSNSAASQPATTKTRPTSSPPSSSSAFASGAPRNESTW